MKSSDTWKRYNEGKFMRAYLFKPRRRVGGKLRTAKCWHMAYKLDGLQTYKRVGLGVRDKQVAEERLNAFVREHEREAAGVVVPKLLREAAAKLMTAHLADFVSDLRTKSRRASSMYAYNVEKRVSKLIGACGWKLPKDVTADSFTIWRAGQTKAAKTLNDYLDAASVLLNWMRKRGRLVANPLAGIDKVDVRGKAVRLRRAFGVEEFQRLLDVAGPRRTLYMAAVLTGLRRNELRALTWADVHLEGVKPFLTAPASTTKNGKAATIWLRDDLAAGLKSSKPGDAVPNDRVFPNLTRKLDEFKADLAAAKIEFKIGGRQADFHALRYTLATNLSRANVAPRVAMELMRHSEMRLTMSVYTDANMLPTSEALEQLPRFTEPAAAVLAATGTDGPKHDAQTDAQKLVQSGQTVSAPVQTMSGASGGKTGVNVGEFGEMSASVHTCPEAGQNWGTRIRT